MSDFSFIVHFVERTGGGSNREMVEPIEIKPGDGATSIWKTVNKTPGTLKSPGSVTGLQTSQDHAVQVLGAGTPLNDEDEG